MACGGFRPFVDHFYGSRLVFDPERTDVYAGQVPVYFLQGALHLMVGSAGTWKLRRGAMPSVLDHFGEPVEGDPYARPLLVTEGALEGPKAFAEKREPEWKMR